MLYGRAEGSSASTRPTPESSRVLGISGVSMLRPICVLSTEVAHYYSEVLVLFIDHQSGLKVVKKLTYLKPQSSV